MRTTLAILGALLAISTAQASVLTSEPGSGVVEGVKISPFAKAKVGNHAYSLRLVGAGLRYKKVAFIKAKVYVGEFFVDAPEKIIKSSDGALASLSTQKAMAIRMTFVRDVDGEKVSNGFKEALETNKVKLDTPAVKSFLDAVKAGGEAKDQKTLVVVGEKLDGAKEQISYENAAGKLVVISGDAGFVRDIFSIWLGKIDDSGLENLKNSILGLKD
ncbi:MAG: chalcone isomerase family protein [Bdellovibrionota bacterium]